MVVKPCLLFLFVLVLLVLPAITATGSENELRNSRHDASSLCVAEEEFRWTKVPVSNGGPKNFSQSGNAAIGTRIFVFGGNYQFGQTFYDDFYCLDTETNRWTKLQARGPGPWAFPAVASIEFEQTDGNDGLFLLYGGTDTFQFDSEYKALGDFWVYSVKEDHWEKMDHVQPNPGPRVGATMFVDGSSSDKIYLFGGFVDFSTEPPNDVWEYNLETKKWKQLIPNTRPAGLLPLGRQIVAGGTVVVNKKDEDGRLKLIVYGGEGFNLTTFRFPILDDLWEFDVTARSWTEITIGDYKTPKRNYAASALVGDFLYLVGGDVAAADGTGICGGVFPENPTDEIWRYHTELQQWQQIIPLQGDPFLPVKDQGRAVVVDKNKIYVVGGYTCVPGTNGGGEREYINDVYVFEARYNYTDDPLTCAAASPKE